MRFLPRILVLLAAAWLGLATEVRADAIWSALVLATNEHPPKPPPSDLTPFAAGLKTVFGYNTFYLLAAKEKQIVKGSEEWIVPTKEVFLRFRCLDRSEGAYHVQLELYVRKKLVVTSEVKLARDAPLYIRGPGWGKGRLIFILEVR